MKRIFGLFLSIWFALVGLSAILFGLPSSTVMAEQPGTPESAIVVNTMDDELNSDGDCALREAITAANDNIATDACPAGDEVITDTITFDVAGTITVTSQLSVTAGGPLVIDGAGAMTISGGDTTLIGVINTGADLALQELTIADGSGGWGTGGIENYGMLEIRNCSFTGNSGFSGGGIGNHGTLTIVDSTLSGNDGAYVGGIFNAGLTTVTNSNLSGNIGYFYGGSIFNADGTLIITESILSGNTADYGGAIYNAGSMTVTNSTLSGNNARYYGGAILNTSTVTLIGSTLSGNSADISGGGAYNYYNTLTSTLTVINSTFSGNIAAEFGGGIYNTGELWLASTSLINNTAVMTGGGVYNNAAITITSSIIADSSGENCFGAIASLGYNIASDNSCNLSGPGDMNDTDPLVGPLQDNGGPTLTHALLEGSSAIDAGDPVNCPPTDQRGVPRPQDGDGDGWVMCDIGSYEVEGAFVPPSQVNILGPSTGVAGQSYTFTAAVSPISATLPVEYLWQASGQILIAHTGGLSDTLAYTWDSPGTQVIIVTAANAGGMVTGTHTITITNTPINGLVASSNSPTILGSPTTFTATIEAGTNVTYTWDFGDDSTASGSVVTHTYNAIGVYTTTVTARNNIGSEQASTVVNVVIPETKVYLPVIIQVVSPGIEGSYWRRQE